MSGNDRVIRVDQRPPIQKTIPLSLQHLFAMFGSTVLVPILFNVNPATVLLFNGIGTLLYLFLCKGRIPAYLGSSFAFISPVFAVLSQYSYEAALGGFIAVGIVFVLVGLLVRAVGTDWINFIFPPAAMGAIVAVIGLELMPVAAGMAGLTEINGIQHMLLRDFNASIGSYGIGIAILANGNPIGCIFASLLFGLLNVIGTTMGRLPGTSIPASIIDLLEGIVMVCVITSYAVRRIVEYNRKKKQMQREGV